MICIPIEEFDPFVLLFTLNLSGIMDHNEARRKSTGGKILGFFY
jgi:ribosomal protein S8